LLERELAVRLNRNPPQQPGWRVGISDMTVEPDNTTFEFCAEHMIRRLHIPLGRPYDDAVADFEQIVPPIDPSRFQSLDTWDENLRLSDTVAPLGLMRFGAIDVLAYMRTSGTDRPGIAYLAGNHTIAERMYRHEPAAMLYAPLRLFIFADDDGQGVLVIDQPSTLFGSLGSNPDVAAVGRELDQKVANVLSAMEIRVPDVLVPQRASDSTE
jgi:uncharacterized protein (DUF302 family)